MPKLLAEYLQEQQEPFALDIYLLERGFSKGTFISPPNATSSFCNFLKCSSRRGLINNRGYVIPNCSKFVKSVFSRLVFDKNTHKNNISGKKHDFYFHEDKNSGDEEDDHEDKFCSSSSTTMFDSCSESYDENTEVNILSPEKEIDADRTLKWRIIEDDNSKQLSPISVLEETDQSDDESSPLHYKQYNLKKRECKDRTSTSQHKLKHPTHSSLDELHEHVDTNSYTQYIINKRALQQTKQLLIDCVREVIENQRKRDKNKQELHKILGAEELWKLVCENVWIWSQDSIDETNIDHILHHDYLDSLEGWRIDFEEQKEVISMMIGDAIFEDIINDIVNMF